MYLIKIVRVLMNSSEWTVLEKTLTENKFLVYLIFFFNASLPGFAINVGAVTCNRELEHKVFFSHRTRV